MGRQFDLEPRFKSKLGIIATAGILVLAVSCGGGGGSGGGTKAFASGGALEVTPATAFTPQGPVGGPFVPASTVYTMSNTGTEPLAWSSSISEDWVSISSASGTLNAGQSATMTVTIKNNVAGALASGTHNAEVMFVNDTDGMGTTSRGVTMIVGGGSTDLVVSPLSGFTIAGTSGGNYVPSETTYTLLNISGADLDWTASNVEPWVSLSTSGGTIESGGQATLTASVVASAADLLGIGDFADSILITNQTNGSGDTTRPVTISIIEEEDAFLVTPDQGFVTNGDQGGPFNPDHEDYVLSNLGSSMTTWTASVSEPWLSLSSASGAVVSGGTTVLTVSINASAANALAPGSYNDDVIIVTDNAGTIVRTVDLTVNGVSGGLTTTPSQGLTSTGVEGGPFSPGSMTYTLQNGTSSSITWSAAVDEAWMQVSSAGGTLAAQTQTSVTVTIDQGVASALGLGGYSGRLDIVNETDGLGTTSRDFSLNVVSVAGSQASSLSQYGITWTFDGNYEVGQFANGDWWVVGPVTIESIDPPSVSGGRIMNGSMVNPDPTSQSHGYDSTMYAQYAWSTSYKDVLNKALDVSPSNPITVPVDSSMISTISIPTPDQRPQLQAAAILTVLQSSAPVGSFRPPYCGSDKSPEWNMSQLDYTKLARLTPPAGTPTITTVANYFRRPWIDHIPDWIGRYHHPVENMPDYGREMCDRVSSASLMLHLDYTDAQKEDLMIRFVQFGIDLYGIVETGTGQLNWPAGGGHHSGRKWPILFAGLVLNDFDMSNIGSNPVVAFNEDDQTFYVTETSPGVYNCGFGGYGPQDVGLEEWGNQHWKSKAQDDKTWFGNGYRACCTAHVWWGEILAAYIMGARPLWNHEALFDYQDRYRIESVQNNSLSWQIAVSPWHLDLWDTHRPNY